MSKVKLLLDVVEDLRSLADSVQAVADLRVVYFADTAGYNLLSEVICHTPEGGESNGENCRTD